MLKSNAKYSVDNGRWRTIRNFEYHDLVKQAVAGKKSAIEELSNHGDMALPALDEILSVTAYDEIKAACMEAIKAIRRKEDSDESHVRKKEHGKQKKATIEGKQLFEELEKTHEFVKAYVSAEKEETERSNESKESESETVLETKDLMYNDRPFEGIFHSASARIIDFLILFREFDYSETDMARKTDLSPRTVSRELPILLQKGIVKLTRKSGKSNMFRINEEFDKVKDLIHFVDSTLKERI